MNHPLRARHTTVRPRDSRRGRGIALVATAAIAVIATVAAMVIITLTLDSTRVESNTLARVGAARDVEDARISFEEELSVSPTFFYRQVFDLERARICTQDGGVIVEPGEPWPVACGTTWSYQQAIDAPTVRMELDPPGVDDPRLTVRILARRGGYETGLEIHYVPASTGRYTLASSTDLDLGSLPQDPPGVVDGEVYSGGVLGIETFDGTSTSGMFAALGGFDVDPSRVPLGGNPVRFYGPNNGTGGAVIHPIGELPGGSVDVAGLAGGVAALWEIACPDTTVTLVGTAASQFCLQPGGALIDAAGTVTTLPDDARAFLLLPSVASATSVDVWWSAKTSAAPMTCGGSCNLASASSTSLAAGTHPGGAGFWTRLGTFPLSDDGVIATNRDLHIGLCGGGFAAGGSCTAHDGTGGVTVGADLTVVVGNLLETADVYLSGPIDVDAARSFGVVSTGNVYLPYWARPVGGTLQIAGSYTALGLGRTGANITTIPRSGISSGNLADVLSVNGGFVAPVIDTTFALYRSASFTTRARQFLAPPPLYPSVDGAWRAVQARKLGSVEICGALTCAAW